MAALMDLDAALHAAHSLAPAHAASAARRSKPPPRVCGLCGAAVGPSALSLDLHMRTKHGIASGSSSSSSSSGSSGSTTSSSTTSSVSRRER
jgi:hypothetical protein